MPDHQLVDAPALPRYDLGAQHPFAPDRQLPLFDLLETHGLLAPNERLSPPPATDRELQTVHEARYVDLLRRLEAGLEAAGGPDPELRRRAPLHGIDTADNPLHPGQHAAAAAAVGGSLALTRAILRGDLRRGFNSTGGLHHAMPAAASGFCLYNDCAVAIAEARRLGARRVIYVDYDVHHGDGVEYAFREEPDVLTISFHETPAARWPHTGRVGDRGIGAGRGSAINMPFASGTTDADWQHIVDTVLRRAFDRFRPDFVVTQHGCDAHHSDPLADLSLTTDSFGFAARLSRELTEQHCGGRWLATGGGGYQPVTVLPRAWTQVWCEVSGRRCPERLDGGWRERWQARAAGRQLPETFADEPYRDRRAAQAAESNAGQLRELLGLHDLG